MIINYTYLNNIKFKNNAFLILVSILIVILLIIMSALDTFSTYTIYAKYNNDFLEILLPIKNSDVVKNNSRIKINDKIYDYKVDHISELYEDNYINYQNYYIDIPLKFKNNEVVKVTFYYKKEKIIKKVIDFIL